VVVLLSSDPSTWVKTGESPELYTWSSDPTVWDHGHPTMRFERDASDTRPELDAARAIVTRVPRAGTWAATLMSVSAAGYVGKRIRLTANVKTDGVADGAAVWMRVDDGAQPSGLSSEEVVFPWEEVVFPWERQTLCNLHNPIDLRLKGTRELTALTCVLDVPAASSQISFGLLLSGGGRAWIGTATLEEVGREVQSIAQTVSD
jgi:hypothetical protein